MAAKPKDPLAEALSSASRRPQGNALRITTLFGDRPDVLEAIIVCRRDKKLGYETIARLISDMEPDNAVSDTAIKNWLKTQGIN